MKTFNGITNIKDQKFEDLKVNGVGTLERITARSIKVSGAVTMKDCSVEQTLHTNGGATLEEITVKGAVSANGGVSIETGSLGSLKSNGGVAIKGTTITGDVKANGGCSFTDVQVDGACKVNGGLSTTDAVLQDVTVSGNKAEFVGSTVRGDVVVASPHAESSGGWQWLVSAINWLNSAFSSDKPQELVLTDSTIHGGVTFEKSGGIVRLRKGSTIKGVVVGAQVIEE